MSSETFTAAAILNQQDQVIASLEGLQEDLAQWDGFRRFSRDVGQLARDQQQLARDTAEAGRETVTKDFKELSAQQQADLKKLGQRQTELARRLEDIERQMRRGRVAHHQLGERSPFELVQEVRPLESRQVVEAVAVLQVLHLGLEDEIERRPKHAAERHDLFGQAADP